MSKSEDLRRQAAEEDNDIKAFGIYNKAMREERNEAWEKWLPRFKQLLDDKLTKLEQPDCWRIVDGDTLDFYPKANKVHIHKNNVWHKPGLKFLIKKFFNNQ